MSDRMHTDIIATKEGYKTCDLYLAAFFSSSGCPIISTVRDSRKVYFHFEQNEIIEKLRNAYFLRQGQVDAVTYADQIKALKSLCASIMGNEIKRG